MQCPKCDNSALKRGTVSAKKLTLDQCPSCKGMWFDKGELCTLLGDKAHADFNIPKFAAEMPNTNCPCCNVSLFEFCYPGTMVLVDGCRQCEGVWLDNSEWKAISHARDESNKVTCPKCHTHQQPAESCSQCGIIMAKYQAPSTVEQQQAEPQLHSDDVSTNHIYGEAGYADDIPGMKGSLLRFIDVTIRKLTRGLM